MPANIPVLYVEDDEGLAQLLKRRLKRKGYNVDIAITGEQCLEMIKHTRYSVILIDYKLPIYSGIKIIELLKKKSDSPPVIMVTGAGDERLAVDALKGGAVDYVVKDQEGIYLDILPSKINLAIQQQQLEIDARNAQIALRENEELLRSTIDSLDDIVLLVDADQVLFNYYVPKNTSINQIPLQEFLNHKLDEILPEEVFKQLDDAIENLKKTDIVQKLDYSLMIEENRYWFSVTISKRKTIEGSLAGFTIVVSDISNRKETEEVLRQSEERFKQLFEYAPTGLAILSLDGHVRHVNLAVCRMLELEADSILDRHISFFAHPSDRDVLEFRYMKPTSQISVMDLRFLSANREIIYATVQSSMIQFSQSANQYILLHLTNTTSRKEAEIRLNDYIKQLEISQMVDEELYQSTTLSEMLEDVARMVHSQSLSDCVYVAMASDDTRELIVQSGVKIPDEIIHLPLDSTNLGHAVYELKQPEWIQDITKTKYKAIVEINTIVAAFPLIIRNTPLGVLVVESNIMSKMSLSVYEQLKALSPRIAIATNSILLQEKIEMLESRIESTLSTK